MPVTDREVFYLGDIRGLVVWGGEGFIETTIGTDVQREVQREYDSQVISPTQQRVTGEMRTWSEVLGLQFGNEGAMR